MAGPDKKPDESMTDELEDVLLKIPGAHWVQGIWTNDVKPTWEKSKKFIEDHKQEGKDLVEKHKDGLTEAGVALLNKTVMGNDLASSALAAEATREFIKQGMSDTAAGVFGMIVGGVANQNKLMGVLTMFLIDVVMQVGKKMHWGEKLEKGLHDKSGGNLSLGDLVPNLGFSG